MRLFCLIFYYYYIFLLVLWAEKIQGRYVYGFFARSCGKETTDIKHKEARVAMT